MNERTDFGFERPERRRGFIVMQALFYGTFASLFGFGLVIGLFKVLTGEGGFIVLLVVSAVLGYPFAYRAHDFIRDLGTRPNVAEGEITRKWSKANFFFFFMHGLYMSVEEDVPGSESFLKEPEERQTTISIYSVAREDYAGLLEGDRVRIFRHPHSLTIEEVEALRRIDEAFRASKG